MTALIWISSCFGGALVASGCGVAYAFRRPAPKPAKSRKPNPPLDFISYYDGDVELAAARAAEVEAYQERLRANGGKVGSVAALEVNEFGRRAAEAAKIVTARDARLKADRDAQDTAAAQEAALVAAEQLVLQRIAALRTARAKAATRWGDPDREAWERTKAEFYNEVIRPRSVGRVWPSASVVSALVDQLLDGPIAPLADGTVLGDEAFTPLGYELHCAELLRRAGWAAETTKGSGDQGADVIATKGALRAVMQCKLYSKPVGNGAVQEVAAARSFYRAGIAVVVTNKAFTPAAQTLAHTTGVLLLHHRQLPRLYLCQASGDVT